MPPPNTTAATAITLTLPASLTVDPEDNGGTSYTLWYKIASIDAVVFSAFAWTDYSVNTYRPRMAVYRGPNSGSLTLIHSGASTEKRVAQWETAIAHGFYWLEISDAGTYGGDLTLTAEEAPFDASVPIGSMYIPSDTGSEPAGLINPSGTYSRVFPALTCERGIAMPSGLLMTGNNETAPGLDLQTEIFTSQFVPVVSVTPVGTGKTGAGGLQFPIISHDNTNFWTIDYFGPTARNYAWEIDTAGNILNAYDTPYPAGPFPANWAAAITRDGTTIIYYMGPDGFIFRWDVLAGTITYTGTGVGSNVSKSMQFLADNTLLVARTTTLRRYAISGLGLTLLNTYTLPANIYQFHVDADDPLHVWTWSFPDILGIYSQFDQVNINTSAIDSSFQLETFDANLGPDGDDLVPANPSTRQMFGHSSSCPFIVTMAAITPPPGPPTTDLYAIRRLRRSPHLSHEQMWQFFSQLQLDIQAGVGLTTGQGSDPQLMLRISQDGGFTWGNEHWVSAGKIGEYTRRAIWRRLGRGRDVVFEVTMSDPVLWALLDAEINFTRGTS